MKNLKFPLLFAIAILAFGFIPTEAKAQYHRGSHCEQVVRFYDHCDGWKYKVIRYYDRHCGQWRERHVRVARCGPSNYDYHRRGRVNYDYGRSNYHSNYRSRYNRHRQVSVGGIRFTVDSRRGLSRGCR